MSLLPSPCPLPLTELQVPVHDPSLMQVAQAADQATQIVADFWLRQRASRLQDMGQ